MQNRDLMKSCIRDERYPHVDDSFPFAMRAPGPESVKQQRTTSHCTNASDVVLKLLSQIADREHHLLAQKQERLQCEIDLWSLGQMNVSAQKSDHDVKMRILERTSEDVYDNHSNPT